VTDGIKCFARVAAKILKLDDVNLLARKISEHAFHLFSVKAAIHVREFAQLERLGFLRAFLFGFYCGEKIEILQAAISLHVPVRERAVRWIPQQNQQLDLIVVIPNSFHRGSPVDVNWRAGAEQNRCALARAASVQRRVINLGLCESLFVIEKMAGGLDYAVQLVFVRHLDFRMALEEIRQRSGAGLLRANDNKIQFRSRWAFEFEQHRKARLLKTVTTFERGPGMSRLMAGGYASW